uniref:OmpA-like domain-containing protein n=1 Tax=Panagrellus redivivus TaxID=6233 RepID=A0A7E4VFD1_PANRE
MSKRSPKPARDKPDVAEPSYPSLNFEEDTLPEDEYEEEVEYSTPVTRRRSISPRKAGYGSPRPMTRSRSSHSPKNVSFLPPPMAPMGDEEDLDSSYDGSVVDLKDEIMEYLGAVYAMICGFCSRHNIFAVFFMLFIVFYFSSPPTVNPQPTFADDVKTKITAQDDLLGRALLLIGKRLADPTIAVSDGPLAFTVASGNQSQLNSAITAVQTILTTHFHDSITTERIQTFSAATTRDEVRSLINSLLFNANGKVLIVLGHIDRLRSTAPLALQTPTDKDNAPYKNPVYVTAIVDEEAFSAPLTRKECTANAERLLDTAWTSEGGLSEDQASPVISRLTTFNICLAPGTF